MSDILNLQVSDFEFRNTRKIREKKTSKTRFLYLNERIEKEILDYIQTRKLELDDFLIWSRKHDQDGKQKAISRTQAYRVLKEAGEEVGVSSMGTHTMRKTFGYHYYKKTKDVVTLMRIFNHSSQRTTLRYIGIEEEELMQLLEEFYLL